MADDTFNVMDGLRDLGVDVWFNLGDRDLALCLERARRLQAGERLTEVQLALGRALGVETAVLPMCDERVQTRVRARGEWWGFQEFMIRLGGSAVEFRGIEDVELEGIDAASPTPEVLAAIAAADAIVIGPSNPVISVGPILGVPGLRDALGRAKAPVVAVSPIVGGRSLKGPTEGFLEWAGLPATADGVASHYGDLLDGMVCDEPAAGDLPVLQTDTMLDTPDHRRRVAEETLRFAEALA
jgi:LPPG:FO 2-phospho-L-lactate transferase